MELITHDELVLDIISYLPLKLAVQCKVVSKNFNCRISDPKFIQTLLHHDQKVSTLLFSHTSFGVSDYFPKIFSNLIIPPVTSITVSSVVASCNGLLLLDFYQAKSFCVFNPITGAYQLIPYPKSKYMRLGNAGLAVDYPTSDQYKLVTIEKPAAQKVYRFHVFSSGKPGLWREFELRMTPHNTFSHVCFKTKPAYVNYSLHWLRADGRVLAFDAKREEATILDLPEFIHRHNLFRTHETSRFLARINIWLGTVQGLLTLVCAFNESTFIASYDYESNNWRVSSTFDHYTIARLPIWIDGKQMLFMEGGGYLYGYDVETNSYKIVTQLLDENYNGFQCDAYSFKPTLARVHETLSTTVDAKYLLTGVTSVK